MNPHKMSVQDLAQHFDTDIQTGLHKKSIAQRLEQYGQNALPEKKPVSSLVIFLRQFLNPLMFILIIAAGVSSIIGEFSDALVICLAAFINVIIGFIQEWRADKAAQALRSYEVPHARVRRDGKEVTIEARNLVPGDIVLLSEGIRIPADIRLAYINDFQVEEALLTGESAPVTKTTEPISRDVSIGDRTNIAHAGTYALKGKAEGIVVATGQHTALGDIAALVVQTEEQETPLQIQIKKFSWLLGGIMVAITLGIIVLGLFKNISFYEISTIAIALAVAAVPEGLLVAVTVILAIGMQRMLKRKALVRHLIAAETLGSVSVICTDKTGTLTQGRMAVVYAASFDQEIDTDRPAKLSQSGKKLITYSLLNNDAQVSSDKKHRVGSPTEIALLECAYDNHMDRQELVKLHPRIKEQPFSSDKKYMVTVHTFGDEEVLIVKGAPEVVLPMCKASEELGYFGAKVKHYTDLGLRVLAVAHKTGKKLSIESELTGLECTGIIALSDPLRPEVEKTVSTLKRAGIRVVLVTGDHQTTAQRVARGAGIILDSNTVITGVDLDAMSDAELIQSIAEIDVFARVDPRHKIRIVNAWKKKGSTVAMTGDGVNDAPALKAADIGVALGAGSDVSHQVADMVLLDNNLATISAAVEQGRITFDNIRKVIAYLMVDSFSEILLIVFCLVGGFPLAISAVQILWINLVTDGFPHIALTMEPGEPGILKEPPRHKDEPVLNLDMKIIIFTIGLVTDIGLCAMFYYLLRINLPLDHIRTIVFTALGLDSLLYVFSVRTLRSSILSVNPFSNSWLILAVILGLIIQMSSLYVPFLQRLLSTVPLSKFEWGIIVSMSFIKIFFIEVAKMFLRKIKKV